MRHPDLPTTLKPSTRASRAIAVSRIWMVAFAMSLMAARCKEDTPAETIEPYSYCGDGVHDDGEQCDDGNRMDFDGCSECQFDRKGPGELLWVDEDYRGSGLTIGPGGLLYIGIDKQETINWQYNPGVACFNPQTRSDKWKTFGYEEGIETFSHARTIGFVAGLVYRYRSEIKLYDSLKGNLVYSFPLLLHPINGLYLNTYNSGAGIAIDTSSRLYYSSTDRLVRRDIETGELSTVKEGPIPKLPGIALDGEGGAWIDEWLDDYTFAGIIHINLDSGEILGKVVSGDGGSPGGLLALTGRDGVVYWEQSPIERICWQGQHQDEEIEDGCVDYSGTRTLTWEVVIGRNGIMALHITKFFGDNERMIVIDMHENNVLNVFDCRGCGKGSLRVSENNNFYWLQGDLVSYDPSVNEIIWRAPLPEGATNDVVLAPDGTFYILKSPGLMAVRGDGSGLCRDCPWPAPDHDQQRTKRYGAELLEYLPASE